jgi:hypothetical protein
MRPKLAFILAAAFIFTTYAQIGIDKTAPGFTLTDSNGKRAFLKRFQRQIRRARMDKLRMPFRQKTL